VPGRCPRRWCGLGTALGDTLACDHGVDLRTGVGVAGFEGGMRQGVLLDDGSGRCRRRGGGRGSCAERRWLDGSGLTLDNGVVCDGRCAAPGVSRGRHRPLAEPGVRRHSDATRALDDATEQGSPRRRLLTADDAAEPFGPIPFVWSTSTT
jgi:hypothetical protein